MTQTADERHVTNVILKLPIAAAGLLATGLLTIPVVIGGNASPGYATCGELAVILDTIRTIESGSNYTAPKNAGGVSGAYQYIDSTWGRYEGYPSAYLAPPEIQDARAAADVQSILDGWGDVAYVPIIWYWPVAADDPTQLDVIPKPGAGNRLTVREYQTRWLATYETKTAESSPARCIGVTPTEDGYALPIDRHFIDADPDMLTQPHHDYPAIDLMIPTGSPVYAVRGGTVARVVNWPHNCWRAGRCDETCGIGISIDGTDGARYAFCHGSRLNVQAGDTVTAGQLIMWSGDTGRSGAPHLHFEIKINGERRCPQSLLLAISTSGLGLEPNALPRSGCSF